MARKKAKANAEKKKKKITVELLKREHAGKVNKLYQTMDGLVKKCHKHLVDAKIAIAWRFEKKEDADGRLWLGSMKKASDLDRSMHAYDFVLMLNHEFCNSAASEDQIKALIDHELCHAQVVLDKHGEPKIDEKNRKVYRIRKHDVEEFQEIIARHGPWKKDLEAFFSNYQEDSSRPLLKGQDTNGASRASTNGHTDNVADDLGLLGDLPLPILQACRAADLTTIKSIERLHKSKGAVGLADVKGLGSERADRLWTAVKAHRKSPSELQPA